MGKSINKKKLARLLKHKEFFKRNSRMRSNDRIAKCIHNATTDEIQAISDCARNLYKRSVILPKKTVNKLRPFEKQLKALSTGRVSNRSAKKVLNQKGGFLPILAAIASSLLGSLLFKNG
jgi:hypothetical protein